MKFNDCVTSSCITIKLPLQLYPELSRKAHFIVQFFNQNIET